MARGVVMFDLVNEPDNKKIFWNARDGRPSLAKLYLDAMDAIYKVDKDAIFVLEVRAGILRLVSTRLKGVEDGAWCWAELGQVRFLGCAVQTYVSVLCCRCTCLPWVCKIQAPRLYQNTCLNAWLLCVHCRAQVRSGMASPRVMDS